jgi:hypothetical protein
LKKKFVTKEKKLANLINLAATTILHQNYGIHMENSSANKTKPYIEKLQEKNTLHLLKVNTLSGLDQN